MKSTFELGMPWRLAVPAILMVLVATVGMAQQSSPAGTAAACVPAAPPGVTEYRTRTLYAVAELGYQAPDTTRLYASYLLDQFANEFKLPTPLTFTAWGSTDSFATNVAVPVIAAEMMVVIKSNGELRRTGLTQTSLVPAIDAALDTAIRKTLRGEALPPPAVLRIRNDVTLFIALTFEPVPDIPQMPKDIEPAQTKALTPPPRRIERSIARVQVPTARFSTPPRRDDKGSKRVLFPSDMLARGIDGDVSVQYVVGQDGRVTPGTIRLVGATERKFADRILRTLKDSRFFPAEIGGCPAPVLLTESHAFRIDRW